MKPLLNYIAHRARLYETEYRPLDQSPAFSSACFITMSPALCAIQHEAREWSFLEESTVLPCGPGSIMATSWLTITLHLIRAGLPYICLDRDAESLPAETCKSLVFTVEVTCIGIRCPPYADGAEITCVVCTKYFYLCTNLSCS